MKRILKSFVSALIAACIGYATVVVPNVSADTNRLGDINGDGYINSADASILINYLSGNCEISRHNAADLNFDGVISMEDYDRLMAYMANTLSLPTYTSAELTVAGMDTFRSYTIYNYDSHSTSSYTLTANVNWLSLEDEPVTFSDNVDDRVRATDTSVVQIQPSGGTGFIIDDHIIATAAHCVYDYAQGSFVNNVSAIVRGAPVSNISQVLKTCTAVEVHVPNQFMNSANSNVREMYDYALIYVEEDLSEYGEFDLGVPSDEFMDTQTAVTISGFPSETQSNPSAGNMALYKGDGVVLNIDVYNQQLAGNQLMTNVYTSGGDSGGPIYMTSSFGGESYRTVVGIYTSAGNYDYDSDGVIERVSYGTRMTTSLLRFFCNNDYIGSTVS